jgi:type III secretion system chaperone SycN
MIHPEIVAEFGRRLGLSQLRFSPPTPLSLKVADLGVLTLELLDQDQEADLLVSLAIPLAVWETEQLVKALETCSPRRAQDLRLAVGFQADQLILIARLKEAEVTPARLEETVLKLFEEVLAIRAD